MPPSVPSSTPNTPIIQYYPAPSHVPPPHYDPYPITVLVETFITAQYISDDEHPPVFCNNVALDSFTHQVPS